jgi:DNA modification methylase
VTPMTTVQIVPLSSITVPVTRQRTTMSEKHVEAIRDSIEENGLIHSILVSEAGELIAGLCRFRAIQSLAKPYQYGDSLVQMDEIPVLRVASLSEPAIFRLELEENLRRKNLSPAEEAVALARLHKMLHAERGEMHFMTDTAVEASEMTGTDISRQVVSDSMLIASFADDPDVIKAASREEALRTARKKLEAQFTSTLGGTITQTHEDLEFIEGDAITTMECMRGGTFSCIIVDPPYGVDADHFGDQANIHDHGYMDDTETSYELAAILFSEGFRVCKDNAHMYMFCDIRRWPVLAGLAKSLGWQPFATPLIWDKGSAGHAPRPGYFLRRYETILFAEKGSRQLTRQISDVISIPSDKEKQHAAQKPVALYKLLMEISMTPGEQVLDPCCGRGTVFLAAIAANMRATGIELHPNYANIARSNAQGMT